jgi:hypothetical protein
MPTDLQAARQQLEQATGNPVTRTEAHYLLWEICQACGDRGSALTHLETAIRQHPIHTRPGRNPVRSVLALATPGDLQANLPLAMLFDDSTALHTLWLTSVAPIPSPVPPADCVIIAIAESATHRPALAAADQLAARLGLPVLNRGATIASLSRPGAARLLSGVPGAIIPDHTIRSRAWLPLAPTPLIIRPAGSHAGRDLALIKDRAELDRYLDQPGLPETFLTAPFVDYRGPDRLYRKCRIAFVAGRPHPVHLAIHDDWAVWYYNANMDRSIWKQAEEAAFMADLPNWAGPTAMRALHAIAERVNLDYFGLDCAIMSDGKLLVFEVETGMLVRNPRVRRAMERLIEERSGRHPNARNARRREPRQRPVLGNQPLRSRGSETACDNPALT